MLITRGDLLCRRRKARRRPPSRTKRRHWTRLLIRSRRYRIALLWWRSNLPSSRSGRGQQVRKGRRVLKARSVQLEPREIPGRRDRREIQGQQDPRVIRARQEERATLVRQARQARQAPRVRLVLRGPGVRPDLPVAVARAASPPDSWYLDRFTGIREVCFRRSSGFLFLQRGADLGPSSASDVVEAQVQRRRSRIETGSQSGAGTPHLRGSLVTAAVDVLVNRETPQPPNGRTPISQPCSQKANALHAARPTTTAVRSLVIRSVRSSVPTARSRPRLEA